MRNSLFVKLMGGFIIVIVIGALVFSFFTSRATLNAFNLYTSRNGQALADNLAPTLADYYTQNNGWQGVEEYISSGLGTLDILGLGGNNLASGNGSSQGQRSGTGRSGPPASAGGPGGLSNQRIILADQTGKVLIDTQGDLSGKQLPGSDLAIGTPVMVDGSLVGTLLIMPEGLISAGTSAGEFINSVNQSILIAVLISGVIALILGGALFSQITSPLRRLNKAALAIAQGDLDQKVDIHSNDELGNLGQTFNLMADNLSKAETQRRQLFADIAHELRTPLAAIRANLEGLLDGVLPFDNQQVSDILDETLLLNRLVGDLRLLSLAEAGELKLEYAQTNLGELVRQVSERFQLQAQQKGVHLETIVADELPHFWIDPDRISQVVNNLAGNALRYTPQGGKITLEVRAEKGNEAQSVSVTDSGPGIPADELDVIFERFYRIDPSRSRSSGGSGLGLAIVKQLVEAHGGKATVQSPVFRQADGSGYGSRFTFSLPQNAHGRVFTPDD